MWPWVDSPCEAPMPCSTYLVVGIRDLHALKTVGALHIGERSVHVTALDPVGGPVGAVCGLPGRRERNGQYRLGAGTTMVATNHNVIAQRDCTGKQNTVIPR